MSSTTRLNNPSTQLTSSTIAGQTNILTTSSNHTNETYPAPYQRWKGNNTICCQGRVIGGPQKQNFFYTLLLIIFPSIFFIGFVSINYIRQYNQYHPLIVYVLLLLISVVSFTLTAFIDPGIIPRDIVPATAQYKGPIHLKQRMCISGKLVEIKWCGTCHIFRPPRSFHCYICNNCVERFDHHCPWIGNCIGIRNYAYFTIFVNALQLLCFWALGHCIYILYKRTTLVTEKSHWKQFKYALRHEYMAFGTGIYVFIGMWFVIGLAWFHWFLVFVGKTTNEQLRNLHPSGSPFKRSFAGNIIDHCCKFPPTSVHLHDREPTASYNELYVNKSKVILLGNAEVEKHQKMVHSMHMSNANSPFRGCLVNNFGYCIDNNKPLIAHRHTTTPLKHTCTNGKNLSFKNGMYSTHIQMTNFKHSKVKNPKNGYIIVDKIMNENDGKIEEEEMVIGHTRTHNDIEEKQTMESDKKIMDEMEENKYENERNKYSESKSRKDENIDGENLYCDYDDESENDNTLHEPQFRYSRSVTPDMNAVNTPEPMMNGNSNGNQLQINVKNNRNQRNFANVSKVSVPAESPRSPTDNW